VLFQARLLAWGWIMAAMMIPESVAGAIVAKPWMAWLRDRPTLHRHTRALATLVPMYGLVVGNMIGFSVGLGGGDDDGSKGVGETAGTHDGGGGMAWDWRTVALSAVFLFTMAQLGYEHVDYRAARARARSVHDD